MSKELKCRIYKLTSKTTKMSYIGQTTQYPLTKRFKNGKGYLYDSVSGKPTKFGEAIIKYGFDDFVLEVLEVCSKEIGDEREKFYIEKYDTFHSGYNSESGGTLGKEESDDVKKRKSESLRGHSVSEEAREAIRQARKTRIGQYKHSDETKIKMSKNNYRASSCFILDLATNTIKEYRSIRELINDHKDFVYSTVVDSIKFKRLYKKRYIIRKSKRGLLCEQNM